MDDSNFFLGIWSLIVSFCAILTVSAFLYCNAKNNSIVEMVKNGASPMEARCALRDAEGNDNTCVIHLLNTKLN